jgi:hypothetical protein
VGPLRWAAPELIVEREERAAQPPVRAFGVQEWRDHDGTVAAWGLVEGENRRMILPGLGTFVFTARQGDPVRAAVLPEALADGVEDAFRRMVVPMVLQVRGLEVLHSSAVLAGGVVVAFCGVSHSGKSTMSYGFGRRGHLLWADDSVAFDATKDPVAAQPLPFRIRFRRASEAFFAARGDGTDLEAARQVGARSSKQEPLGVLFVLAGRGAVRSTQVRRLSPAQAFPVVLEHAYCFSLEDPDRKRAMVGHFLDLVRRVPAFEVHLPAGFSHLDHSVERLEAVAEDAVAASVGTSPAAP